MGHNVRTFFGAFGEGEVKDIRSLSCNMIRFRRLHELLTLFKQFVVQQLRVVEEALRVGTFRCGRFAAK